MQDAETVWQYQKQFTVWRKAGLCDTEGFLIAWRDWVFAGFDGELERERENSYSIWGVKRADDLHIAEFVWVEND